MKKIVKITSLFVVALLFTIGVTPKAEAATTSWHSVSSYGSGCKVQGVTDSTTYKSGANTIDAYLKTNGKCRNMEFTISLDDLEGSGYSTMGELSGFFKNQTGTKKFSLSKLKDINKGYSSPIKVQVWYTAGGVGFHSPTLSVYK
ncbi:hypothetical protein PMEGAS67_62950 [Priestia megaterium]